MYFPDKSGFVKKLFSRFCQVMQNNANNIETVTLYFNLSSWGIDATTTEYNKEIKRC